MVSDMKQRGFTLVELMVAAAIALLVLVVVAQSYLGGLKTQTAQTDQMRVNESGRFALDVLARELRLAGFANNWQPVSVGTPPLAALCGAPPNTQLLGLNDPPSITETSTPGLVSGGGTALYSPGAGTFSDVLRVRYHGENIPGTPPLLDCRGVPVAATPAGAPVEDTLYVRADPINGEPTLYCYSNNPGTAATPPPGSEALVSGVESMQLLYGEITSTWPREPNFNIRYAPWSTSTNPSRIVAVKVSIVVRGPTAATAVSQGTPAPLDHFGSGYSPTTPDAGAVFPAQTDNRIRAHLTTEIALRNRCQ